MDEREAVTRLKRGDICGLEALVREHHPRAIRTAFLITRDRALAEDIVQEAFLRAYDNIDRFDAGRSFGPWFLRIVTNHSIRAATRAAREIPLYAGVDSRAPSVVDLLPDGDPGPQESAEREELRSEAWDALSQLPPSQRAAVVMRYYLGYSESQIANELACASGTVKWRLHAARAHLQSLLRPVLG